MPQCHDRELSLMAPEQPAGCSKMPSSAGRSERRGEALLCAVRWASERRENKAGGLFQHPGRHVQDRGMGRRSKDWGAMVPPSWDFRDCWDPRCP